MKPNYKNVLKAYFIKITGMVENNWWFAQILQKQIDFWQRKIWDSGDSLVPAAIGYT